MGQVLRGLFGSEPGLPTLESFESKPYRISRFKDIPKETLANLYDLQADDPKDHENQRHIGRDHGCPPWLFEQGPIIMWIAKNGRLHKIDGPAVTSFYYKEYWIFGAHHRLVGAAQIQRCHYSNPGANNKSIENIDLIVCGRNKFKYINCGCIWPHSFIGNNQKYTEHCYDVFGFFYLFDRLIKAEIYDYLIRYKNYKNLCRDFIKLLPHRITRKTINFMKLFLQSEGVRDNEINEILAQAVVLKK